MGWIDAIRQWGGAILALIVIGMTYGHANAGSEIAFAMPMCIVFVCMAAYSSRRKISELQAQIDDLRRSVDSQA